MPRIPTAEIEVNGRKKIVNADDPRVKAIEKTPKPAIPEAPEDVDAITDKDQLRELLDAHEAEYDARSGVPKLQEILKSIMFVGTE